MPSQETEHTDERTEQARMSFGDHLDDLRRRVILGLLGLVAATIFCFNFGDTIIGILTAPYTVAMEELGHDPRMVQLNPIESFMEYFKISLKFGFVLAVPWILYQLWRFISTGLYAREQRIVRLFAPTSIALFLVGASFMIVVVLSGLMHFLIGISSWFPLPNEDNLLYKFLKDSPERIVATTQTADPPVVVPILSDAPANPAPGRLWFNPVSQKLNLQDGEQRYAVRMGKVADQQFVQPFFSIAEYLGFVVNLALAFGLGFQIPIVVVFLITVRLVSSSRMASARKYVFFAVAVMAAVLTPSPDVSTMMLLAVPMIILFEAGLIVGRILERRRERSEAEPRT